MDVTILTYLDTFLEESQKRSFIKSLYDSLSDSERVEFLDILPANMIRYTMPSFQDELEIIEDEEIVLPGGVGVMREPSDDEDNIQGKQFEDFNELLKAITDWNRNKESLIATYGPVKYWDVTQIKNMDNLFLGNDKFNEDISGWDVSNVTSMNHMFASTYFIKNIFNQPIDGWDVSSVENMDSMFEESSFNQDISEWYLLSLEYSNNMFNNSSFNNGGNPQGLENWIINADTINNWEDMFTNTPISRGGNLPSWYEQRLYPYLHKKVKLQELPNVPSVTLENIPNCYDLINLEYVNTTGFINEDTSDNIGFVFGTGVNANTTCMKRGDLKTMLSDPDGNNLNYKCQGEGYENWERDIDTSQTYFRLTLNDWGGVFVPVEYIVNVIENTAYNLFLVNDTGTRIDYSMGYTYYHKLIPGYDVSTWHCGPGSDLSLCTLSPVNIGGPVDGAVIHEDAGLFTQFTSKEELVLAISNLMGQIVTIPSVIDKYGPVKSWDVTRITDMSGLFEQPDIKNFNEDISGWDVSNVENMNGMFEDTDFNQPIGNWDVGNVKNMSGMFKLSLFNEDISGWDVSNVENMSGMFEDTDFNQPIGNWDVSNVENMDNMFKSSQFDQPIGNWVVSNVKYMDGMFKRSQFNLHLNGWDVSKVKFMSNMFKSSQFDQPIGNWVVSNVKYMDGMFKRSQFDQDISGWDVSNVKNMYGMFNWSEFDHPIGLWNVSNVENMDGMFNSSAFNQDISGWDVSKVENMSLMFTNDNPFFEGFNNGGNPEGLEKWKINIRRSRELEGMFTNTPIAQDLPSWYVHDTNIDIIEFNQGESLQHFYPYLNERVELQEFPNVPPITLENIPNCDLIMKDVETIEFINDDTDTIGFVDGVGDNDITTTCMSKSELKVMLADSEGNYLYYRCTHTDSIRDIDTSQTYFKLKLESGVYFVPVEYMINVIENIINDLFLVNCTGEKIDYSVDYAYYYISAPGVGVSTWHCDPGSDLPLCTLIPIGWEREGSDLPSSVLSPPTSPLEDGAVIHY